MRQYSDSERSSAAASFARSVQSLGGTRSFSSSVHFSLMRVLPEKESLPRVCPGTREGQSRAMGDDDARREEMGMQRMDTVRRPVPGVARQKARPPAHLVFWLQRCCE